MKKIQQDVMCVLLQSLLDQELITKDNEYQMSGNKISVKTLDLNCDFSEIAAQLNHIVEQRFGLRTLSIS